MSDVGVSVSLSRVVSLVTSCEGRPSCQSRLAGSVPHPGRDGRASSGTRVSQKVSRGLRVVPESPISKLECGDNGCRRCGCERYPFAPRRPPRTRSVPSPAPSPRREDLFPETPPLSSVVNSVSKESGAEGRTWTKVVTTSGALPTHGLGTGGILGYV